MKFRMNNIEFEIKEVSQKEYREYRKAEDAMTCDEEDSNTKGTYFGATHCYQDIIFLDKALPLDRKRKTLMHELTHCYIAECVTHQEKQFNEEDVADISANAHDIIHKIVEDYFKPIIMEKNVFGVHESEEK